MKKIAIIRGADLGEYEMQNYASLVGKGLDLVGFTSKKPRGEIAKLNFPVKQLYMLGDFSSISKYQAALCRFFGDVQIMVGLERALEGFDIAHSAETFNYYTYQAVKAKLAGRVKKVVVTVWQNIPLVGDLNPAQKKFKKVVLENTDLFHAVTQQAKEALLMEGVKEGKIKVLPYGINLANFNLQEKSISHLKEKLNLAPEDFVILSIGRLVWEKGFDFLLMAFRKVLNCQKLEKPSLKLIIAGDGPRKEALEQMVTELDLRKNVFLIGRFPYEEIPNLHAVADVFVLPSLAKENWQEQLGMVLLESMASGKPIIGADSGAISEVIGDAGVLVPPGNFIELAKALEDLINDDNLRQDLSKKSRQRAEREFNAEKVSLKIKDIYLSLC